jgi:hypothetical protein
MPIVVERLPLRDDLENERATLQISRLPWGAVEGGITGFLTCLADFMPTLLQQSKLSSFLIANKHIDLLLSKQGYVPSTRLFTLLKIVDSFSGENS